MSVPSRDPLPVGHETRDVRVSALVKAGLGIAALIAFTMVTMVPLLAIYRRQETAAMPKASPLAGSYGPTQPPEPRLQVNPAADLASLRAQELETLTSYGWADRAAGRVRIPIARAMELLAQRRGGAAAR